MFQLRSAADRPRQDRALVAPVGVVLLALTVGLTSLCGCEHGSVAPSVSQVECVIPEGSVIVPGNADWIDAGVDVSIGENVAIVAGGSVVVGHAGRFRQRREVEVTPAGTYIFSDKDAEARFPLPAAGEGPAPCFALIGRIGNGPPFFIGRQRSWKAKQSGRLRLGVNDHDLTDNSGQFYAHVSQAGEIQPVAYEEVVPSGAGEGRPRPGSSVVVFYVDGLRPDVVREMAAMGHIPNINALFVEGGAWLSNNFTAFPSDTITSNGTMWTGCFSDRHGIKGQVRFSRAALKSQSYLDPLGPNRSARLLQPQGVDRLLQTSQAATIRWTRGEQKSKHWNQRRTTGVTPLYGHLRAAGGDWATGVLPMMTDVPPLLWTRSMTRHMPYFRVHQAWKYIDDANAHYAIRHLVPRDQPVTIIWLPETDSISHKHCRGQFGATRRTIALADELVGKIVDELQARKRLEQTYFILVSDHGHHGGRKTHLTNFDIANEFLFKPRELDENGNWVGGGLGLSVRQHRSRNFHRGDNSRDFVFIDGDTDGAARIFLSRGRYGSGDWSGPNRPGDLLAYPVARHLPPINLVKTLSVCGAIHGNGSVQTPIDLVLLRLDEQSILISTRDRGQAVVSRKKGKDGEWLYRYAPVTDVQPTADGHVAYRVVPEPETDPLELIDHIGARNFHYYHSERRWLNATALSKYPDGVVALTRHMLWQENLSAREPEFAPDLVITARPGWYFGSKSTPGTNHGYPLADSMRATWFVSGPNVRRGARIEAPSRLTDLTPTILDMIGLDTAQADFDGIPLRVIYEPRVRQVAARRSPLYWDDVDLDAWRQISYTPAAASRHKPFTINRPQSAFDLNNVVYNAATVTELSVFRLFDDVTAPLVGREEVVTGGVEAASRYTRHYEEDWVAQGAQAINVSELTIGDYSMTSLGNLRRADGLIDWTQTRSQNLDRHIATRVGRENLPGSPVVHTTIDATQAGVWEVYRFVQRVAIEVLDETVLNGIENSTDRAVNAFRRTPSEIRAERSGRSRVTSP